MYRCTTHRETVASSILRTEYQFENVFVYASIDKSLIMNRMVLSDTKYHRVDHLQNSYLRYSTFGKEYYKDDHF